MAVRADDYSHRIACHACPAEISQVVLSAPKMLQINVTSAVLATVVRMSSAFATGSVLSSDKDAASFQVGAVAALCVFCDRPLGGLFRRNRRCFHQSQTTCLEGSTVRRQVLNSTGDEIRILIGAVSMATTNAHESLASAFVILPTGGEYIHDIGMRVGQVSEANGSRWRRCHGGLMLAPARLQVAGSVDQHQGQHQHADTVYVQLRGYQTLPTVQVGQAAGEYVYELTPSDPAVGAQGRSVIVCEVTALAPMVTSLKLRSHVLLRNNSTAAAIRVRTQGHGFLQEVWASNNAGARLPRRRCGFCVGD